MRFAVATSLFEAGMNGVLMAFLRLHCPIRPMYQAAAVSPDRTLTRSGRRRSMRAIPSTGECGNPQGQPWACPTAALLLDCRRITCATSTRRTTASCCSTSAAWPLDAAGEHPRQHHATPGRLHRAPADHARHRPLAGLWRLVGLHAGAGLWPGASRFLQRLHPARDFSLHAGRNRLVHEWYSLVFLEPQRQPLAKSWRSR